MMQRKQRLFYLTLTIVIIGGGLVCRWPGLGLPWIAAKYAGSILWGTMVYAGLRVIRPTSSVIGTASAAGAVAVCVECLRLYRQPALDAFRTTLTGQLLLGRIYSIWNIVAYLIGIGCVALGDFRFVERWSALQSHYREDRPG